MPDTGPTGSLLPAGLWQNWPPAFPVLFLYVNHPGGKSPTAPHAGHFQPASDCRYNAPFYQRGAKRTMRCRTAGLFEFFLPWGHACIRSWSASMIGAEGRDLIRRIVHVLKIRQKIWVWPPARCGTGNSSEKGALHSSDSEKCIHFSSLFSRLRCIDPQSPLIKCRQTACVGKIQCPSSQRVLEHPEALTIFLKCGFIVLKDDFLPQNKEGANSSTFSSKPRVGVSCFQ